LKRPSPPGSTSQYKADKENRGGSSTALYFSELQEGF
jgi:hypothetical protein